MNAEEYWARVSFYNKDKLSEESFKSSEIFSSYYNSMIEAGLKIAKMRKEAEERALNNALESLESLEENIKKDPALLKKFQDVKRFILENPDKLGDVDPSFISGISMLSLGDCDLGAEE